jgi:L-asparaginase
VVELDTKIDSVGAGGVPNMLGEVECDAAVMCGATLRAGAVAALKDYAHAISVARQVMERSPHVLLAGEGAIRFAAETGAEKCEMLTEDLRTEHRRWLRKHMPPEDLIKWPNTPLLPLIRKSAETQKARGTAITLARSTDGHMAVGASSAGWIFKYPGRVGDSAVVGGGLYVDDRYGGAACTHTGEMTIRAGTARAIVAYMKKGATAEEACREALNDLRSLKDGYLDNVTIHAVDVEGNPCVVSTCDETYWFWAQGMPEPDCRKVVGEPL